MIHCEKATARYEGVARTHTALIDADLRLKHKKMAESVFPFFRATLLSGGRRLGRRSVLTWRVLPRSWRSAIFTSRTSEPGATSRGRLFGAWNDFRRRLGGCPTTNDLVRMAASVLLAIDENRLVVTGKDACAEILDGYSKSLAEGGQPFGAGRGQQVVAIDHAPQ